MVTLIKNRYLQPLWAALFGVSTSFAFAPYSFWPIAIISPLVLLLLIANKSAKASFWLTFCWGLGFFIHGLSWIHVSIDTFGGMPIVASYGVVVILCAYLALYPALFGWFVNRFFPTQNKLRYFVIIPCAWLVSEWLRGWMLTGFPWLWLGYSQIDSPLASWAPIAGVELITLVLFTIASSIAYAILSRQKKVLLLPLILCMLSVGLKFVDWVKPNPESKTSFALVQANIDQKLKWVPEYRIPTLKRYVDLTMENWDADIVIWPEAAIPAYEWEVTDILKGMDTNARINQSALITGILNQVSKTKYYNSILTLGLNGQKPYHLDIDERYHKHHLLPFGEFVPFERWLRPIAPLFNLPMSSFSPGNDIQPNLEANGRHLVAALCYEIVFNEQIRENTTDDTDFILTLSNDAWFGHSIGPLQHMEIARMRALELGKPVIRATNNGVTAITDYKGNIRYTIPQFTKAVLKGTATSTSGETPYKIMGSWPLYAYVALIFVIGLLRRKKQSSKRT